MKVNSTHSPSANILVPGSLPLLHHCCGYVGRTQALDLVLNSGLVRILLTCVYLGKSLNLSES